MSQSRLNGLAKINFHYELDNDCEAILLDMFARKLLRRLALIMCGTVTSECCNMILVIGI